MSATIIPQLIRKDIALYKNFVLGGLAGGALAILLILLSGGGVFGLVGIISFFIAMIVFASLVPSQCLVNERKHQTLPFVMSLPVSPVHYTIAKIASALVLFLVPWITMTAVGAWIINISPDLQNGLLPIYVFLCLLVMAGMVLISGVALVAESEGWFVAATIVVNVSYNFAWVAIVNTPALMANMNSPTPVWNSTMVWLIGGEIAVMAAALALTVWLQSRKRDFFS